MEGTRKRWRDEVEGDLNVGPNGGESRQAVRRGRRGMEGDFMGRQGPEQTDYHV